ncbi:MAG: hypothetical protein R3276_05925 [Marinobacter sp.]|nr:hypothetical protein [Marinobacter sp.]
MNKITTIAAMALFGLMASATLADEMASDDGMMKDDMKGSMDDKGMKKNDRSGSMGQDMKKDGMADGTMDKKDLGLGMKDD